jgi:hypothetical protein
MANGIKIQQPVDPAKQMILGNMILDPKPIKQLLLRIQQSHHHPILSILRMSESDDRLPIQARIRDLRL